MKRTKATEQRVEGVGGGDEAIVSAKGRLTDRLYQKKW